LTRVSSISAVQTTTGLVRLTTAQASAILVRFPAVPSAPGKVFEMRSWPRPSQLPGPDMKQPECVHFQHCYPSMGIKGPKRPNTFLSILLTNTLSLCYERPSLK